MAKRIPLQPVPAERPAADVIADIRRLYFETSRATIDRDFDRAIDLLKSLPLVEDRQRATVYMEGIAEMRKEWGRKKRGK